MGALWGPCCSSCFGTPAVDCLVAHSGEETAIYPVQQQPNTHFHQWMRPQKSALGFPSLFCCSDGNTGHCQTDKPPPAKHSDRNTQCTTSSHSVGGLWIVLRPDGSSVGTFPSVIPKSVTAKGLWVGEKSLLCGFWTESQQHGRIALSRAHRR